MRHVAIVLLSRRQDPLPPPTTGRFASLTLKNAFAPKHCPGHSSLLIVSCSLAEGREKQVKGLQQRLEARKKQKHVAQLLSGDQKQIHAALVAQMEERNQKDEANGKSLVFDTQLNFATLEQHHLGCYLLLGKMLSSFCQSCQ